jgi:hypothetical protein
MKSFLPCLLLLVFCSCTYITNNITYGNGDSKTSITIKTDRIVTPTTTATVPESALKNMIVPGSGSVPEIQSLITPTTTPTPLTDKLESPTK